MKAAGWGITKIVAVGYGVSAGSAVGAEGGAYVGAFGGALLGPEANPPGALIGAGGGAIFGGIFGGAVAAYDVDAARNYFSPAPFPGRLPIDNPYGPFSPQIGGTTGT